MSQQDFSPTDLQRLAHDVKNALNGVAVNLEVARIARHPKGVADPSQLTPYLDNAAQQLDIAAKLHKQFADLAVVLPHDSRPALYLAGPSSASHSIRITECQLTLRNTASSSPTMNRR